MGSYKWGYKSLNMGYNYSKPHTVGNRIKAK